MAKEKKRYRSYVRYWTDEKGQTFRLSISFGNSKIGETPNVSLSPFFTCREMPCFLDGSCYARKAFAQYSGTRNAWTQNAIFAAQYPREFFALLGEFLERRRKPIPFFRFHPAGEVPSQEYMNEIGALARRFPQTRFLVFTKTDFRPRGRRPRNLAIIRSSWPNVRLPKTSPGERRAFLAEDRRLCTQGRPKPAPFVCPGACETCRACWHVTGTPSPIVFHRH